MPQSEEPRGDMEQATHTVYIFYPYTMAFTRTPFEGSREEMLAVAEELQDRALQREEKGMYIVRPIPDKKDAPPEPPNLD